MSDAGQSSLSQEHRDLLLAAAITSDVAEAAEVFTASTVDELPEELRDWPGKRGVPGIVFTQRGVRGGAIHQLRPDKPIKKADGGEAKYVFARDVEMVLTVHPMMRELVTASSKPLVIVEGTKQHLAAVSALVGGGDYAVVGMPGCYGWSQQGKQIADLKAIPWRGRTVYEVFDADMASNRDVWDAADKLTGWVRLHRADDVRYVALPGGGSLGLDDVLAETMDPPEAMRGLLDAAAKKLPRRPAKRKSSTFFDEEGGLLTEKLATALLEDRPCALTRDGRVAVYASGVYRVEEHALNAVLGDMLGDKFRVVHAATVKAFIQGRLFAEDKVLGDKPRSPWLNCHNGMLDLTTLELHPHDPEYLSTIQLPVDWDPDAECPTYEEWLPEQVAEGQVDDLEEITATMLDPITTPAKSLFAFGPSRSGKSTYLRLMREVMGDAATSAVTLHALSDDRFAAGNLYGKKLNIAADLPSSHVEDLSTWKMLTGEDVVTANLKNVPQFTFTNQALFAFSANELPTVNENSKAYFARVKPFSFPHSFLGAEDASIEHRMHAELPGVLRRWVTALRRLRHRGRFLLTPMAVSQRFETASDRVRLWMSEEMTVQTVFQRGDGAPVAVSDGTNLPPAYATTVTGLHDEFKTWAKDNSYAFLGKQKFKARLTSIDGVHEVRILPAKTRALNIIKRAEDDHDTPSSGAGWQSFEHCGNRSGSVEEGSDESQVYRRSSRETATSPPGSDEASGGDASSITTRSDDAEVVDLLPTVRLDVDDLTVWVYEAIAPDPAKATEGKVREALRITATEYKAARDYLIAQGVVARRKGKGFDLLARLVVEPAPYAPMTSPEFVNDADGRASLRALLHVDPRPCPLCGADTDDPASYFPFCSTHRLEAS